MDTQTIIKESISSVKELRDEIKRLKDSLVTAKEGSQEWTDTVKQLTAAQEKLTTINNAHKQSVDAAKDSIVGMEREYKALYDTYKLLSEEQRNSDFGKNMADQLKTLHDKLNETKQGVGNFKDNIGNYTNSVMDAFKKLGMSVKDLKNPMSVLNGGLGSFKESAKNAFKESKNMWTGFKNLSTATKVLGGGFAVATAAVVGFVKVTKDAIKNNEELSMRMQESMAVLQPIKDWWANFKDTIGSWGVAAVEALTGWIAKVSPAAAAAQELAHAQNELVKTRREYNKLNADDNIVVERLRDEAAMTDNYSTKIEKLKEAKQKQEEIDKRNVELAKEELRLLEERAKQSPNNAEANEALTQSYIKLAEAEAKVLANNRQYDKQITSTQSSQTSAIKSATDAANSIITTYNTSVTSGQEYLLKEAKNRYDKELKELNDNLKKGLISRKKYNEASLALEKIFNKECVDIRVAAYAEILAIEKEQEALRQELIPVPSLQDFDKKLKKAEAQYGEFLEDISNIGGKFNSETLVFDSIVPDLITDEGNLSEAIQKINLKYDVHLRTLDDINTFYKILDERVKTASDSYNKYAYTLNRAEITLEKIKAEGYNFDEEKAYYEKVDAIRNDNTLKEKQKREQIAKLTAERTRDSIAWDNQYYNNYKNQLEMELELFHGTKDEKIQLETEYYNLLAEIRERDWQKQLNLYERQKELDADLKTSKDELFATITSGLQSSMSSINSLLQSEVQEGKLNEQQVKKRKNLMKTLEAISLAAAVAQIAADTASGIMGVWKGYGLEQAVNAETAAATGPAAAATLAALNAKSLVSAGIKTGIIATAGAANLASAITGSISNFKSINSLGDSGSGDASIYSAPSMSDSTPYSYVRTAQTQQEEDALKQPTIVSVVDIENALNKRKVRTEETTF